MFRMQLRLINQRQMKLNTINLILLGVIDSLLLLLKIIERCVQNVIEYDYVQSKCSK